MSAVAFGRRMIAANGQFIRMWILLPRLRDAVVTAVRPNPPPKQSFWMVFGQRAIAESHTGRPKLTDLLESDGRMPRVGLHEMEVLVGEFADFFRQLAIVKPELRRCEVLQSGLQRPASKSASARLPAASKRPAWMSASI